MLSNKKVIEEKNIYNIEKKLLFKVQILEDTLSDDSKVFNIETSFYGKFPSADFILEDSTAENEKEANCIFSQTVKNLYIFKETQVL